MTQPIPNIGVLYADRTVNAVVKAWDVRQNLQALQQSFQRDQLIDVQAGLASIKQVQEDAKQIWGPQGDYTRKLVDRFQFEFLHPTPGPTPFSNTLNTALNSFTGHMVGNVLVTNEEDRWNDFLRTAQSQPSLSAPSFPGWDELRAKLNIPVTQSITDAPQLTLAQVLGNLGATPTEGSITAFTAPQPYQPLVEIFPKSSVLETVQAFEGHASLPLRRRSPNEIIAIARSQLGVDYVWGGETPAGFDCSGLVQWVFGKVGVELPRTTWPQFASNKGDKVNWAHLQPADVLYFNVPGSAGANHTGIYIGNGKMIVAPHSGAKVQIQPLQGYWQQHFIGGKRFL